MKLLGGNTHLAAKSEFTAVGEAGAGVDIDAGAVHQGGELCGVVLIVCNDRIAVMGTVRIDMCDCLLNGINCFYRKNIRM